MSDSTSMSVLVDAYVELASTRGAATPSFMDLWVSIGMSKSTAYRAAPGAIRSLVCELHQEVVAETLNGIEARLGTLSKPILLQKALETGVCAAVDALERARLTGRVLGSNYGQLGAYLLNPGAGGLMAVLGSYVTKCAYAYGSLKDPESLKPVARRFVAAVIATLVSALVPDDDGRVNWPDDDLVMKFSENPIRDFICALGDDALDGPAARLALPYAIHVPERPTIVPEFGFLAPA